jgi:hypothetical protein
LGVALDAGPRHQLVSACAETPHTTLRYLHYIKTNFYSNERQLHGSSSNPADAHVCGDFFNVIILRDPMEHVQSLLLNTYINTVDFIKLKLKEKEPWVKNFTLPSNMETWVRMAPAVVNNHFTRTLVGRSVVPSPLLAGWLQRPARGVGQGKVAPRTDARPEQTWSLLCPSTHATA